VQDKTQVPVIDDSVPIVAEDVSSDEHVDPCMVCEVFGDESQLLLCDGCNHSCHVFCAGLDSIPAGAWFCYTCCEDPRVMHNSLQPRAGPRRATSRGTRGRRNNDPSTAWARLWRSVASRTGIDLEHPFDEEEPPTEAQRATLQAQRREFREWERRFQVAGRVAGPTAANRLRGLALPPQPSPQPTQEADPESQEEIRAWNAFEKARLLQHDDQPARGRRKRRSRENTPEDERPIPERKRKRPRILRIPDADLTDSTVGEPSRPAPADRQGSISRARPDRVDGNEAPTFLQSLLNEVESHTSAHPSTLDNHDANGDYYPYGLERGSSPEGSPCASGVASPRAMTPLPHRPNSPTLLTSSIEPIYPPPPEIRPNSPPVVDSIERARSRQRSNHGQQSPGSSPVRHAAVPVPVSPTTRLDISSPVPKPLKSVISPTSPTNMIVSPKPIVLLDLKTKTEIQALVKAVLKPLFSAKQVTSEEYTDINRDVSRKLYDQIGTETNFSDAKERWKKVAEDEVHNAVQSLRAKAPQPESPTSPDTFNNLAFRKPETASATE
jgi:hypothetical protein